MKNKLSKCEISVKKSAIHGYGVFADQDIKAGTIIEECHGVVSKVFDEGFHNYYFLAKDKKFIPLGFGCIYNHSNSPNADYSYCLKDGLMVYKASLDIKKDDEILISYGEGWFSSRSAAVKDLSFYRKLWRKFKGIPLRGTLVIMGVFSLPYCISVLRHFL